MTENTNTLSQEQRLLAEKKKQEKQGTMTAFSGIGIDIGIPVRQHFPNLRNSEGKTIKDDKGYAQKSDKSDGYSIVLAVFGKPQFVHLVLPKALSLKPATAYSISGFGYDISGMLSFHHCFLRWLHGLEKEGYP